MKNKNTNLTPVRLTSSCMVLIFISGCAVSGDLSFSPQPEKPAIENLISAKSNPRLLRLPPVSDRKKLAKAQSNLLRVSHEIELLPAQLSKSIINPSLDSIEELPTSTKSKDGDSVFRIDLANALALGGANNLQIQLARERVLEAEADLTSARAILLPSLRFGVGYNKHDGRLQETEGKILEVSRNSLFVGGGAGLGGSSLAGGSGGPARLMVNLSLADAAFEPLIGQQLLEASDAAETATFNDALLAIATAYYNLVEASSVLANTKQGLTAADKMVDLTTKFADAGNGSKAEVYRATANRAAWKREVANAHRKVKHRQAHLARLLRLDPNVKLVPVEEKLKPITVYSDKIDTTELIAMGLTARPELAQHQAMVAATISRLRQEWIRPWLPNIQVGASGGTFGGGPSATFDDQSDRSDIDLLAVWELKHLGFGNAALRRKRFSQMRQAELTAQMIQDNIAVEILTAAADVSSYREQLKTAEEELIAAKKSYDSNWSRIQEAEGLPIELQQAIRARTSAQNAYTQTVSQYNKAQYRLLRAIGQPPEVQSQGDASTVEKMEVVKPVE